MKRILYGYLVGFIVGIVLIQTSAAVAAPPPDRARSRAVGHNRSAGNDGSSGANTAGPYDPYGVGEPSGNGNGDGNATGKTCAGCVGNADGKNPPGQQPGPNDANKGYECDENAGIAQGNPAHSFCKPTTTSSSTTSTTVPVTTTSTSTSTTSTTVPVTTTSTSTSTTSTTVPVTVTTTSTSTSTTVPTEVLGISVSRGKLPITGGDISLLLGLGSGFAIAGAAFTKLAKIPKRK